MTVWFGAEDASYDYSVVYGTERGLTVQTLTASQESISVANGTSLNAALSQIVFHATYAESSIPGVVTDYTIVADGGYDAAVASTYTVTVARDGVEETVSITVQTSVEVTSVTLLKEYGLNEDGDRFTDGDQFAAAIGDFAHGGFKANAVSTVTSKNPLSGQTLNAGFTIHLEVYVNSNTLWAPIVSINKEGGNGHLSILLGGNGIQVSYNDWAGNFIDISTGITPVVGQALRITVSVTNDGNVAIYVNDEAVVLTNNVIPNYSNLSSDETWSLITFFGGGNPLYWENLFDGYIQSCAIYNGVVSAEDVPNL